jgi:TRAP-type uncharacterized transport system fused permease subunit
MFAFYFAILSAITPPVALAVYAAAGLAKTDLWQAGWEAVRVASPAYIVPFMFVYEPQLLLIVNDWTTQWPSVTLAVVSACIGAMCLAASLMGWLFTAAPYWQRAMLFVAALLLIKPGMYSDLVGLALLGIVAAVQITARRRSLAGSAVKSSL